MMIQRRVFEANRAIRYFLTHNWDIKNEKMFRLSDILRPEDEKQFTFKEMLREDIIYYVRLKITTLTVVAWFCFTFR
jgi:hypothetical protein